MTGYSISAVALTIAVALCGCATNSSPKPSATAQDVPTGSRLSPGCAASPCRSYTQDDIQRTGQTTVAGALGMLDPALTITH